jgi:hypothetical protein
MAEPQLPSFELSEELHKEVVQLARVYRREAEKCLDSKAFLAGCMMIGAALEALLLAFVNCYPDEASTSQAAPRRKGSVKPVFKWSLADLLAVAKERGWLHSGLSLDDEWDDARAQIGDYGEVIRRIRNLVHPARYVSDFPRKRITACYLESCFEILEVAIDYLQNKIEGSIREAIERDPEEMRVCKSNIGARSGVVDKLGSAGPFIACTPVPLQGHQAACFAPTRKAGCSSAPIGSW